MALEFRIDGKRVLVKNSGENPLSITGYPKLNPGGAMHAGYWQQPSRFRLEPGQEVELMQVRTFEILPPPPVYCCTKCGMLDDDVVVTDDKCPTCGQPVETI